MSTLLEKERIQTLKRYEILDTPKDVIFERLTSLASKAFNVPIAIISLVDQDRIWFKSHTGYPLSEICREPGFCASAILSSDIYIIEDARNDPRCCNHSLVSGGDGIQFYAGMPIKTKNGFILGTFCIMDKEKRTLSLRKQGILKEFACMVMDEIETRLSSRLAIEQVNNKLNKLNLRSKTKISEDYFHKDN